MGLAAKTGGPHRESNPGPLAPEARIIPLDHAAAANQSRKPISNPTKTNSTATQQHNTTTNNRQYLQTHNDNDNHRRRGANICYVGTVPRSADRRRDAVHGEAGWSVRLRTAAARPMWCSAVWCNTTYFGRQFRSTRQIRQEGQGETGQIEPAKEQRSKGARGFGKVRRWACTASG